MSDFLKGGPSFETIPVRIPAIIHPQARKALQLFSRFVRLAIGKAILELQRGRTLTMPLSRPMPDVGAGVHELRVKDPAGAYRALYFVKSQHGVYVIHVFEKRSRKTPHRDIELARKRLKEVRHAKS